MHEFSALIVRLGDNVRQRRKAQKMTQAELAQRADLHRTYVADVERGGRNVSIGNVAKLARALRVSVSDLCEGIR